MKDTLLRVATYNIHRCVGVDGRYAPERVIQVLNDLHASIIGLQEIDTSRAPRHSKKLGIPFERRQFYSFFGPPPDVGPVYTDMPNEHAVYRPEEPDAPHSHQLDLLIHGTGLTAVEGLVREKDGGLYGNALLTSHPVRAVRRIDLTVRSSHERRGALDVDLDINGRCLRVFVAHLGLGLWERYFQIRRLLRALEANPAPCLLMMGDFNLWSSLFPRLRPLHRRLGHVPLVTTFPSPWPFLPLDRMWVQPAEALVAVEAYRTPLTQKASDHLPLVGSLRL